MINKIAQSAGRGKAMKIKIQAAILVGLLSSGAAVARDYAVAGKTVDATIVVDRAQLKSLLEAWPHVVLKWAKHWKEPRDYGLGKPVQAEGFDSMADCSDRSEIETIEHRFLAEDASILKKVEFGDRDAKSIKGIHRDAVIAGSPESIALDYACSWLDANR